MRSRINLCNCGGAAPLLSTPRRWARRNVPRASEVERVKERVMPILVMSTFRVLPADQQDGFGHERKPTGYFVVGFRHPLPGSYVSHQGEPGIRFDGPGPRACVPIHREKVSRPKFDRGLASRQSRPAGRGSIQDQSPGKN